jgi:hypothetical protein
VGSCEYGNELWGSIDVGKFPDKANYYQLLKKNLLAWWWKSELRAENEPNIGFHGLTGPSSVEYSKP